MGLLVSSKLFPIEVRYVELPLKSGGTTCLVIKDAEQEKKYEGRIKTLSTQWAQPNFKESNDLLREATIYDPYKGERDIDWYLYRGLSLEKFVRAWDLTEDDKPVPCTKENIARLDVNIATALIQAFDARNMISEEELKN